jgi:hypothetical protein
MPATRRICRPRAGFAWVVTLLAVASPSLATDFYAGQPFDTSTALIMTGLLDGGPNHVCSTSYPGTFSYHHNDPTEKHLYKQYDLYNNGPDRCVSVNLVWQYDNCDFEIGAGLYLGSFNPTDPTQNLLAHTWTDSLEGHQGEQYTSFRYSPGYYRDLFQKYTLDSLVVSAEVPAFAHVVLVLDSTYQPGQPPLTCPKPTGGFDVFAKGLSESGPSVTLDDTSNYDFGPAPNQGGMLQFPLSLAAQAALPLTVHVKTSDGPAQPGYLVAVAGVDYTAVDMDVTFQPGETFKYVNVPLVGDNVDEAMDKLLTMTLSNPNPPSVQFAKATATGRIINDDAPGGCYIKSPGQSLPPGVVGQPYGPVTLHGDDTNGAQATGWSWAIKNPPCLPPGLSLNDAGTADATIDGTPTAPGTYKCTVHELCPVLDNGKDVTDSPITIVIAPETPQVIVTLDDSVVLESKSGPQLVQPNIHIAPGAAADFKLEVLLLDASATAAEADYQTLPANQTITIPAGQTTVPLSLNVIGDTSAYEDPEKFLVVLRTPITKQVVTTATVTILDQTPPPTPAIPTLDDWGLVALGLGLAILALGRLRRGARRAAQG